MKNTETIAAECGLDSAMSEMLDRILEDRFPPSHPLEASAHDIIGALYRRIEKLEEEKAAAYAELRKHWSTISAVFDRSVWDAAEKEGK